MSRAGDVGPTGTRPRRLRMLGYWVALGLILAVFILLPLINVVANEVITGAHGCVAGQVCIIGGRNWEYDLEGDMFLLGIGVLLALASGATWLIVLLIHRAIWRRRFR